MADVVQLPSSGGPVKAYRGSTGFLQSAEDVVPDAGRVSQIVACIGDSINGNTTSSTSSTAVFSPRGPLVWANALMGWPLNFPIANNLAVGGTATDAVISGQLPSLLALNPVPRFVLVSTGTNDTNAGTGLATIKNNLHTLFQRIIDGGMIPIHIGILPRDSGATNAKRANTHLNNWMREYFYVRGGGAVLDAEKYLVDPSNDNGDGLAEMFYDSALHPNSKGAYYIGLALKNCIETFGYMPQSRLMWQGLDLWDATYNPTGSVLSNGMFRASGGTAGTGTAGTVASGFTVGRTAGNGTATASLQTQAIGNGQTINWQRLAISGGTAASETFYVYDDRLDTGTGWGASDPFVAGDQCYAEARVKVSSSTALKYIGLELVENDGATQFSSQCLVTASDTFVTQDYDLVLRTPVVTIRSYAGSGTASVFARANCSVDGTASGAATFDVSQMVIRKVHTDIP